MTTPIAEPPLKGRSAVVTGASAGIGRAIAVDLARAGASVVVNARRKEKLDAMVGELENLGAQATAVAGDAADPGVIRRMLEAAHELHAPADLVVANAGRGLGGSALTSDREQWEEMIRINLTGLADLLRAAGAQMIKQNTDAPRDLVVLGSTVGRHVSPFSSMYGATKFAANSLAEATRRELGPQGVRVTLIEPGIVVSEFQSVAGYSGDLVKGFHEKFGPLIEPEDVARTITFIASQPAHVHINDVVIRSTRQDYP